MAPQLKNFLVCPLCKGDVEIREGDQEIWCRADGLAFPIRDDIPVMLADEARTLTGDERTDR
ncbi:MAG: Trm112 family protein [Litorivicinaceae bacterium]|nr:hypothetical protein [Gammaproteobacteria bacterium]RPG20816.1 MAG: Trm112 family protein [Oceanospirillales bacterium TMED33]RZO74928.1 MAG: Trm112 family protein [Litorivicinaceae bacterium]